MIDMQRNKKQLAYAHLHVLVKMSSRLFAKEFCQISCGKDNQFGRAKFTRRTIKDIVGIVITSSVSVASASYVMVLSWVICTGAPFRSCSREFLLRRSRLSVFSPNMHFEQSLPWNRCRRLIDFVNLLDDRQRD